MKEQEDLDRVLADVILDRALEFSVGARFFRLYPVTLAKQLRLRPHIMALCLNDEVLRSNPYVEALRVASDQRGECCHILALCTTVNTREAFHDDTAINERRQFFQDCLEASDLGALMLHVLSGDRTDALMKHLGLDHERERLSHVLEVKKKTGKNNLSFGGVSLLGAFIGQLQEMGYTDDEILYERSYSYLRLRLADKVTSIYVTDEELSQIPTDLGGTFLRGDDPDAADGLLALFAERGVTSGPRKAPREQ